MFSKGYDMRFQVNVQRVSCKVSIISLVVFILLCGCSNVEMNQDQKDFISNNDEILDLSDSTLNIDVGHKFGLEFENAEEALQSDPDRDTNASKSLVSTFNFEGDENKAQKSLSYSKSVTKISGNANSEKYYSISVPSNQYLLEIKTSGGTGNCDLYVKLGAKATMTNYNYKSTSSGTTENVTRINPASGIWYITVRGAKVYSGVSLSISYSQAVLTIMTDKLAYTPGNSAIFRGSLKTAVGTPIVGYKLCVDNSLSGICQLCPETDSNGAFTYTAPIGLDAMGIYGLVFNGPFATTYVAVVVNPTFVKKLISSRKVNLGITTSLSSLTLGLIKKNSSKIPNATIIEKKTILQEINDLSINVVGDFVSNPANDVMAVAAAGCAVGIWSGVATIPCATVYSSIIVTGLVSTFFTVYDEVINTSTLTATQKKYWKNLLKTQKCAVSFVLLTDSAFLPLSAFSTTWTCGSAYSTITKDSKNREALKIVGLPKNMTSASIGIVAVKK
jgi:hypothetical protein